MNETSSRNERFVLEGMNLLTSINDLKEFESKIFSQIAQFKAGSIIDNTAIFKYLERAEYFKVKTSDIVGTIALHTSMVSYEMKDIENSLAKMKKNAHISKVSIKNNIPIEEVLPPFDFTITNLGFEGIVAGKDEFYLKLHNPALDIFTEKTIPVSRSMNNLMESKKVSIIDMECPSRAYEYYLLVQVRDIKTKNVFGEIEITSLNIAKEVRK